MKLFATTNQPAPLTLAAGFARLRASRLIFLLASLAALSTLALADEPILKVARVSLIEGEVSYQRAGSTRSDWFDATINTPLGENDQLYSGAGGRAEIQLNGRNLVRINRSTNLKVTQFTTGITQLALSLGTATFRIESLDRRQFQIVNASDPDRDEPLYFEVDTPTVAITFLKEGTYRINVREDGTTEVIVRRGSAEVYNQTFGTIPVKQGRQMFIEGTDVEAWRVAKLDDKDDWDRWNDRRNDDLYARSELRSSRYVPNGVAGLYELDHYGDWYETSDYGYVWSPRAITVGWAPYRSGDWRYYPTYGWTWISSEPWGWAPYHYGRWSYYHNRWCWVPHGGFGATFSSWSWHPSLVVFFGWGGGGYSSGYRNGYRDGYYDRVGWIPLGPGERYYGTHGYGNYGRTVINNITINNNNDLAPRALGELKNANAPGGITGVSGQRFLGSRVVIDEKNPPQQIASVSQINARDARPLSGRSVEMQPRQVETPRAPIANEAVSRRMQGQVVTRRAIEPSGDNLNRNGATPRAVDSGVPALRGTGRTTDGPINRPTPDRAATSREQGRDGAVTTADRSTGVERSRTENSGRTVESADRQTDRARRQPDYRPVERPIPPSVTNRRAASEDSSTINRSNDSRTIDRGSERRIERSEPPRSREPQSSPRTENRNEERPSATPSRRVETPSERPAERSRPEPREAPRERPVERHVEPARTEKPSSPPAERSRPAEPQHSERGRGRPESR